MLLLDSKLVLMRSANTAATAAANAEAPPAPVRVTTGNETRVHVRDLESFKRFLRSERAL